MKELKTIIAKIDLLETIGDANGQYLGLTMDSREVKKGFVFFAINGTLTDGHNYISKAIELSASAIVCERKPDYIEEGICYLIVKDSSEAMAVMASAFYDNPSSKIKLVGVTGTNGKTSVVTLLFDLFRKMKHSTGMLSTVVNRINETIIPSTHTTPDVINLNALLAKMVEEGCEYCFIEVSSHAINQKRIHGLHFTGAAFTNLSHDHLDYHKTFSEYRDAKKAFFDNLSSDAFALVNKDDKNGKIMVQNCKAPKYNYALKSPADFKVKIGETDFNGMLLNIDGTEVWFKLMGDFNAYNLLAVYAISFLLGLEREEIITQMSALEGVKGRFETFLSGNSTVGIVDYAHTPDALENILKAINKIRAKNEQLITVVGCGGNRDQTKRPIMGNVAARLSDKVIFTSDNPRGENPEEIISQITEGVDARDFKKTLNITNRAEAIKTAVLLAQPKDIILIAGKGHEDYQEINGVKHHFDDKEELIKNFELIQS
jgi:UDP-N-acetylmuramoyl-L-alanyl-D-glutamate--2,6-diaminopimelate ligase